MKNERELLKLKQVKVNSQGAKLLQSPTDSNENNPKKGLKSLFRNINLTILSSLASVSVAIILVIIKALAAHSSDSNAVLASLADSGLDLVASFITLLSVKYAQAPPDKEHRYGHGKAEALAGVFQAGLVAVSAFLIILSSIDRIMHPMPLKADGAALAVMGISIILTFILVSFQSWALKQTGSIATKGDMTHYLSDLLSNLVGLIGIFIASKFHLYQADSLAGLFIAIWLLLGAWHIATEAADHLLDHEAPKEIRDEIKRLAEDSEDVHGVHALRTRMSGPWLHAQFHLDLPEHISLREAHRRVVATENRILAKFPQADIIIHPDPEESAEPHGNPSFTEG